MKLFGRRQPSDPVIPITTPSPMNIRSMDFAWLNQGGADRVAAVMSIPLAAINQLADSTFSSAAEESVSASIDNFAKALGENAPPFEELLIAAKLGWGIGRYEKSNGLARRGFTSYLVHNGLCRARQMFQEIGITDGIQTSFALEVGYYISRTGEQLKLA